jgi:hypothetical protein
MAFSNLEKAMAAIIGIQLAPGGAELTRKVATRLIMGAVTRAPAVATGIAAIPGAPGAIGAGLGYAALQTDPGQQLLAMAAERGRQDRLRLERYVQDTLALAPMRRKKRMSKFNQAVKKGMSIIKSSTAYGKKGVINNPKKAFSAVTKAVSKVSKAQKAGKKKPKSGNVVIKKVLSAAAKIIEKRGIKTYRKRYDLPKRKDYRDYDPQGTMFD